MSATTVTHVYQLPADESNRAHFLNGLRALAETYGSACIACSVHDEMSYADRLEKELSLHAGEGVVENIRQEFEQNGRHAETTAFSP